MSLSLFGENINEPCLDSRSDNEYGSVHSRASAQSGFEGRKQFGDGREVLQQIGAFAHEHVLFVAVRLRLVQRYPSESGRFR